MGIKLLCAWWTMFLLPVVGMAASGGDLRLVEAVKNQNKEAVRTLLKQHVNVNAAQTGGSTALAWAAHWDDLDTAQLLIRAGADVSLANDYGVTALSLACANGSAPMVGILLKAGANPNATKLGGETVLMTAALTGNVEAVKLLLDHGADVNAKENRRGQTALMWAVAQKHSGVVRLLIEHGADVHARTNAGLAPVMYASQNSNLEFAQLSDLRSPRPQARSFTPLLFAAHQGDVESARILLSAGANANEDTPEGSALLVSSLNGYEALSILLLEKGAEPNTRDLFGFTPLHFAVSKGISALSGMEQESTDRRPDSGPPPYWDRPIDAPELIEALLAHKADPNVRIAKDPPPLPDSFRIHGSRVHASKISLEGATPFFLAAAAADLNVMRMLVAAGANPLLATQEHTTPLMAAAGLGRIRDRKPSDSKDALEAVKLAVELGADVNAVGENGWTAMHAAAYNGADAIVQFLADKGAKLDVKDKFGQTPLSIAEAETPPEARAFIGRPRHEISNGNAGNPLDYVPEFTHDSTAALLRKLMAKSAVGSQ